MSKKDEKDSISPLKKIDALKRRRVTSKKFLESLGDVAEIR